MELELYLDKVVGGASFFDFGRALQAEKKDNYWDRRCKTISHTRMLTSSINNNLVLSITKRAMLLVLFACMPGSSFAKSCNSVDSIQWLLGNWVADDEKNTIIESWKQVSPLTFEGFGESIDKASGERQISEFLRIVEMDNALFYLAKPKQNDLPVAFKLTYCSSTSAVFENQSHDFPKKLDYTLGASNKMKVVVAGDKGKSFEINFIRRD